MSIPRNVNHVSSGTTLVGDGADPASPFDVQIVNISKNIDATASELVSLEANLREMASREQEMAAHLSRLRGRLYNRRRLSASSFQQDNLPSQAEMDGVASEFRDASKSVADTRHQMEKVRDEITVVRARQKLFQSQLEDLTERYGSRKLDFQLDFLTVSAPVRCN